MAVLRERRMVRYCILEPQSTEPAIRQIEVYLLAQPALGTNAEAVTHDQHRYEPILNLKTVKVLGLTIAQSLLIPADEVIQ